MKTPSERTNNLPALNFLERIREQLRYWPYTLHQIDDTLDVSLIEGRGRQLLYRAIHSQNLTAFVGSGLSMSYGRLSWKAWEQEQKRVVERNAKLFCKLASAAQMWNANLRDLVHPQAGEELDQPPKHIPKHLLAARSLIHAKVQGPNELLPESQIEERHRHAVWQWLRTKDKAIEHSLDKITRLQETFALTQKPGGHFPGGEELPVKFEIAQQLHNQLKECAGLFLPPLPSKMTKKDRKAAVWASAYAADRTSAPVLGIEKLREFCELDGQKNGDVMAEIQDSLNIFAEDFDKFAEALNRPESHLSFEDLAKALLIDECPHALILLRQGLLKGLDIDNENDRKYLKQLDVERLIDFEAKLAIYDRSNQRRDIKGIRDFPGRYRVLTPFKFKKFEIICKAATANVPKSSLWNEFFDIVEDSLKEYQQNVGQAGDDRVYLTPSSRFLVSVALSLCEDPFKTLNFTAKSGLTPKNKFFAEPEIGSFTSRRSIMADRFDPLNKIERDLGIRNYITTNYDFEIERYFVDQGYRTFEPPTEDEPVAFHDEPASNDENFRSDNIGRILKDQVFKPEQGSDLTNFGLENNSSGANVFHLHGRATEDGNLVITESDYMKLYLTQDENRDTIDEGISMAFSGAPLLFLGLGMEETDLLRPLRQFISNRDRTVGSTSIALLPADRDMATRAKFSAALFLRYGVHTIFYGSGTIQFGKHVRGIDWLYRMIALKNAMGDVVDGWLKDDKTKITSREALIEKLYSDVGKIGPDLAQDEEGYSEETNALNVMLGRADIGPNKDLAEICPKDSNFRLKCCTFTPVRPRNRSVRPHQNEEEGTVKGERHLEFYTELLSQLLRIIVDLSAKKDCDREASLRPLKLALDGMHSALITGSLNAALDGIVVGKQKWWRDWQESPPERIAQAQRLKWPAVATPKQDSTIVAGPDDAIEAGTVFIRHRVDNVITILDEDKRIEVDQAKLLDQDALRNKEPARLAPEYRTRIRAYDTFVAAVACQLKHRAENACLKRQIITVAAPRGLGKGTFMSAASSSLGLQTYKCAAWPKDEVFMAGSVFLNLGFSPEIGSAYDMLTNALINVIALLDEMAQNSEQIKSNEHQKKIRDALRSDTKEVSRLTAFRMLFIELQKSAKRLNNKRLYPRMFINISSVDLLFDNQGRAKNGEIDRFFNLLFSDKLKDCPIDLLFLADHTNLGAPWNLRAATKGESPKERSHLRVRLDRAYLPEQSEEQILRSIKTGQIKIDERKEDWEKRVEDIEKRLNQDFIDPHLKVGFDGLIYGKEPHYIHVTRPMNAISLLVDNFPVLATALYMLNPPKKKTSEPDNGDDVLSESFEESWPVLTKALRKGREASDKKMNELWANAEPPDRQELALARGIVAKNVEEQMGADITEHAGKVIGKEYTVADYKLALRDRLSPVSNAKSTDQWRLVRRSLGNSRFSLTMLLAAAETMLIHTRDAKVAAEQAEKFILETVSQVHNIGQERRDQLVLDSILSAYRRLHVIGDQDLDCEFHFLILRHLGVIGTPVGSAVLVRLAEFRNYFDRIGLELEVSRRRFLVRALTVLSYRGLVFRLEPHPRLVFLSSEQNTPTWDARKEYRYALHRVVQNFTLSNLAAGTSDPIRSNSFAPSLYAVMPSTGSRLSQTSHVFLRSLMIGLSQYPDISNQDSTADPWLFTTRDTSVRVQALRAAMTLARSTFSVAVVSRMASHKPIGESVQKRGLLETYRVRLRWIIRMAWEISDEAKRHKKSNTKQPDTIRVLYRDEIVWLYNELGVISLAQGSLSDALGYLRQAAEQNETIEGRSRNAPIFNHIDLNHGIVQLERGNFKSARTRLNRVFDATASRKWMVYWAAEGYRCVLDHLIGRRQGVNNRFRKVTRYFQANNESRPAAIFLMHQGRFLSEESPEQSVLLLKRARDLSETGGHEDIRHHVELARIKLRMRPSSPEPINGTEIKILQDVEIFGRRTAIWSLQADALLLRANLLLKQGEASSSGHLLIRSMAISKRNAMNLRLNNAMTSYAEVLLLRGDVMGAIGMARQSLELAKRTGYSLETSRAQAVLSRCQLMPH